MKNISKHNSKSGNNNIFNMNTAVTTADNTKTMNSLAYDYLAIQPVKSNQSSTSKPKPVVTKDLAKVYEKS